MLYYYIYIFFIFFIKIEEKRLKLKNKVPTIYHLGEQTKKIKSRILYFLIFRKNEKVESLVALRTKQEVIIPGIPRNNLIRATRDLVFTLYAKIYQMFFDRSA